MAKFCENCGAPLNEANKFCVQCGAPIPAAETPTDPVPAGAEPVQPVQPAPAPQPTPSVMPPMPATPPAYPAPGVPGQPTPPKKSKVGLLIAIIVAVVVVLGVVAYFGFRDGGFLRGQATAAQISGSTEKAGYYKVLVPDGYSLTKGNILDEDDPETFTLEKDDALLTYYMFGMYDDRSDARDNVEVTKEVNEGAKDVTAEYGGVTWKGVAYHSFGYDCFAMYAEFDGRYVVVNAAGNAYDSAVTDAVLSSLRVKVPAATTPTTEEPTTTTTEATTTTAATTTTTTAAPAPTADVSAVAGAYPFTGEYSEYFGETVVDEGTVSGTFRFAVSGSELEATLLADGGNETSFPMSYDPDTMTATYSYESESEVESIVVTFYEAGGNMCMAAVMQFDYPYSDIPSDTYYLNGARE